MQKIVDGFIERVPYFNNAANDDLFVNEEGLLNDEQECFSIHGTEGIFFGNGLIVGHDNNGNTTSCKSSRDEIAVDIQFFNAENI